jgi:putative transposase
VEKVRDGGRVVRKALVLAYAVHESGYREVIGLDVGEAETEAFWRSFLRSLVERGLVGVRLVVSDAHAGLKKAIAQVLGCPWQRCTVHFLREALGYARREQQPMLAALLRPVFNADDGDAARERVGDALERLRKPLPKIAALLEQAEDDLLAFYACPADHWPKLRSTNPLERVNREIGRRTDVVGIFPNDRSLIRLAASVVIEQNDEWLVGKRYLSNHSLEAVLDQQREEGKD